MADDPLDDAIDAVVRAVDRLERATRGSVDLPPHPDALTPPTSVSPGREAWAPLGKGDRPGKKGGKGKKKREAEAAAAAGAPASAPAVDAPASVAPPLPAATVAGAAPGQVHELVGRIVARTQELDEHLEQIQRLRTELNELVARLGNAATHGR